MISIDPRQFKTLERELTRLSTRAIPVATRNFVNEAARDIRDRAKIVVKEKMTLRNRWTINSIRAVTTREHRSLSRIKASAGSLQEYMLDQEFGGIKRKSGSEGVRIATGFSAGQEGARPRTKLPRKANKIHNIKLSNRRAPRNRKQRNMVMVHQAVREGKRFIFMDLGKRKGIFRVVGGRKRKTANEDHRVKGAKVKMIHDLTRPFVRIPPNPWLKPSSEASQRRFPRMWRRQLLRQISREKAFRAR